MGRTRARNAAAAVVDSCLIRAVRVVAGGEALLAPSVTRRIIEERLRRPVRRRNDEAISRLTDRELEVLKLLATGGSNAELATSLYVGEGTVKTHVSNVLSKLGLRDRVQAVVYAYESRAGDTGGLSRPPRVIATGTRHCPCALANSARC